MNPKQILLKLIRQALGEKVEWNEKELELMRDYLREEGEVKDA